MLETINTELIHPRYYLCRPNPDRTTIAHLDEVYGAGQKISLGNLNELNFKLPLHVADGEGKLIDNKHLALIKERYLIRFEKGSYKEYYLIDTKPRTMANEDYVAVNCYSLGYELSFKLCKDYKVDAYNLKHIVNDLLEETIWSAGYMDAEYELKFRSFEYGGSVIEGVQQAAALFKALIVWDTVNRKIHFYNPDNYGVNKGFRTKFGMLMKDLDYTLNMDEFCTRLKLFGKDGISINAVNPAGTNFIQDFSYYIYPFRKDDDGKILEHSDYLSDELCSALLAYNKLYESKKNVFSSLLASLNNKKVELEVKQTEHDVLQTELYIIEDNLATANSTGSDNSPYLIAKQNKTSQISAKADEITYLNTSITGIQQSIVDLGSQLKFENNLTSSQLIELNPFIVEKEFSSDVYTEAQDLWDDGRDEFDKLREPKIIAKVSLVNFYQLLTESHNWDKLNIGDLMTVEHEALGIHFKAAVTEIEFDYEGSGINVTISNAKELLTDEERFMKNLYKSISSSSVVEFHKSKWDDATSTANEVAAIIDGTWDAVKRDIIAGVNETVEISRKGILIKNAEDTQKFIIMQHGQIALTQDGGNTWKTAILPDRIVAERVMGKLLAGVNLQIDATDAKGNKTFTVDQTGVKIMGLALTIEGGLPADQLDPSFKDGLISVGNVYNGVVIDTESGLVITTNNNLVRTTLNASDGFKFEKKVNGSWQKQLYYDVNSGNLVIQGEVNAKALKVNGVNVLTEDHKISTTAIETLEVGKNVIMGQAANISWRDINDKPFIPTNATQIGAIPSTYIDSQGIWAGKINANSIVAGKVKGIELEGNKISGGQINGAIMSAGNGAVRMGNLGDNEYGIEINQGGKLQIEGKNSKIIINEYGLNPEFIKSYKNMIWNSGFEQYDKTTKLPLYWTGGISSQDASFFGDSSLMLQAGQSSQITAQARPKPIYWGRMRTRVSFYKKFSDLIVKVLDQYGNSLNLTDDNGIISTQFSVSYNSDWTVNGRYSFTFDPGNATEVSVRFYSPSGDVYIDAVQMEPDFNGAWPSFYTDGPKSLPSTDTTGSKLESLKFYNDGFKANYGEEAVVYTWTKDLQGRIIKLTNSDGAIPITWNTEEMT